MKQRKMLESQFIREVKERLNNNYTLPEIQDILEAVKDEIKYQLERGTPVELHCMGVFSMHEVKKRIKYIPSTGNDEQVGGYYKPKFTSAKAWRLQFKEVTKQ